MIRVTDIKLGFNEDSSLLKKKAAKKLGISEKDIISFSIFKEAIDARKKSDIKFTYTLDVDTTKNEHLLKKNPALKVSDKPYELADTGEEELKHRPVVVGSGPCGLFAALALAVKGFKPIVVERGRCVDDRVKDIDEFFKNRVLNVESNVQFGEGGAGTFSDGKLTTGIKNERIKFVLKEMVEAGAPDEILYKSKPHIGTDILIDVVRNIRNKIISLGGKFLFETKLVDLNIENGKLESIILADTSNNDTLGTSKETQEVAVNNLINKFNSFKDISSTHFEGDKKDSSKVKLYTDTCIIAIGHSARDTFNMLYDNKINIIQKPFSIGMRVEHLQEWINMAQYGKNNINNPKLHAADYKLVHHASNGRSVYSFCMCPGGYVIASTSNENQVVTNGMSRHARAGANANSAILVNVDTSDFPSEHPLAGTMLQEKYEKLAFELGGRNYNAPMQRFGDFKDNKRTTHIGVVKPTYEPGVTMTNIREHLPKQMGDAIEEAMIAFGKKIERFDDPDAIFTGFETRSSSPIRITRTDAKESTNTNGVYPAGEGAGYAGGITSAAVDGIVVAEAIISRYKPTYI